MNLMTLAKKKRGMRLKQRGRAFEMLWRRCETDEAKWDLIWAYTH